MGFYADIYKGIISVIRSQVGARLYQQPDGQGGTVPDVRIGQRNMLSTGQSGNAPTVGYPYITVDRLSTKANGGWVRDTFVNESDNVENVYDYQALYLISCYSGPEDEEQGGLIAEQILTDLKLSFSLESVRLKLYKDSNDTAVFSRSGDTRDVYTIPEISWEFQPNMEIRINFTTTLADPDSTIIEQAEIEGAVINADGSEIPTTINVP